MFFGTWSHCTYQRKGCSCENVGPTMLYGQNICLRIGLSWSLSCKTWHHFLWMYKCLPLFWSTKQFIILLFERAGYHMGREERNDSAGQVQKFAGSNQEKVTHLPKKLVLLGAVGRALCRPWNEHHSFQPAPPPIERMLCTLIALDDILAHKKCFLVLYQILVNFVNFARTHPCK